MGRIGGRRRVGDVDVCRGSQRECATRTSRYRGLRRVPRAVPDRGRADVCLDRFVYAAKVHPALGTAQLRHCDTLICLFGLANGGDGGYLVN